MISSEDSIILAFEYQTIQSYTGEPNYEALKLDDDKLKTNTTSTTSTLEGRNRSLLGLMMSDSTYFLVSDHTFVTSTNPCILPTVPTDSTATNTYGIVHQHKHSLQIFTR